MTHSTLRTVPRSAIGTIVIATLALTAGCATAEAKAKPLPEDPIVHVTVARVIAEPVPTHLVLTGSLRGNREARIAADTTGTVVATYAERGDLVQAGAPLARIDARSAALAASEAGALVESARVEETQARSDCDRAERLFSERAISPAEHEKLLTACSARTLSTAVASTRAAIAKKSLGDTVVRAPFSGVVGERLVTVGEYVHPGGATATLVALDPLELDLSVPESAVSSVHEDQAVDFEVATFPGERFHGTIKRLGASLELPSRSLVVEATAPNPDRRLRPGMFATARVMIGSTIEPVVPAEALVGPGRSRRVFVVRDRHLEERVVLVGESVGTGLAITSGIQTADLIVTRATPETRDGARVE